jgi:hypothetical protein
VAGGGSTFFVDGGNKKDLPYLSCTLLPSKLHQGTKQFLLFFDAEKVRAYFAHEDHLKMESSVKLEEGGSFGRYSDDEDIAKQWLADELAVKLAQELSDKAIDTLFDKEEIEHLDMDGDGREKLKELWEKLPEDKKRTTEDFFQILRTRIQAEKSKVNEVVASIYTYSFVGVYVFQSYYSNNEVNFKSDCRKLRDAGLKRIIWTNSEKTFGANDIVKKGDFAFADWPPID